MASCCNQYGNLTERKDGDVIKLVCKVCSKVHSTRKAE